MKKILLTILSTGLIFGVAVNCKKKSDEEFLAEFGKTVCYKVADCTLEKMKGMPEAQQQQMKAFMPSRESCDKKGHAENPKDHKVIVLTSEEKEMGQKCMDEMKKTSCNEMGKEVPSCKEFTALLESKEKS
jgi:hypothetical protein